MIILILSIILAIYVAVSVIEPDDLYSYTMTFIIAIAQGALFLVGASLAIIFFGSFFGQHLELSNTQKLASIDFKNGISGSFFLGTGTVGDAPYYFYMINDNDAYIPKRVQIDDNIRIKESSSELSNIKQYEYKFNNKIWYLIALPEIFSGQYVITIPKGSIKNNFNMQ